MNTRSFNESQRNMNNVLLNENTIENLVYEFIPNISRYAKSKGLDEEINDIIQDVFMIFLEESKKRVIRDQKAFLFGITNNKIKEYCKRRKKANKTFISLDSDDNACEKFASEDLVLKMEKEELLQNQLERLRDAFQKYLTPYEKKILEMKYFEEMTSKEISSLMQKKDSAIRKTISRSEQKLRRILLKNYN